jgi:hypothetical protein
MVGREVILTFSFRIFDVPIDKEKEKPHIRVTHTYTLTEQNKLGIGTAYA